jgi:hypothetical protein
MGVSVLQWRARGTHLVSKTISTIPTTPVHLTNPFIARNRGMTSRTKHFAAFWKVTDPSPFTGLLLIVFAFSTQVEGIRSRGLSEVKRTHSICLLGV